MTQKCRQKCTVNYSPDYYRSGSGGWSQKLAVMTSVTSPWVSEMMRKEVGWNLMRARASSRSRLKST